MKYYLDRDAVSFLRAILMGTKSVQTLTLDEYRTLNNLRICFNLPALEMPETDSSL